LFIEDLMRDDAVTVTPEPERIAAKAQSSA